MCSLAVEAFAGELRDAIVCALCLGAVLRATFPSARICVFPAHLVLKRRRLSLRFRCVVEKQHFVAAFKFNVGQSGAKPRFWQYSKAESGESSARKVRTFCSSLSALTQSKYFNDKTTRFVCVCA